MEIKKTAKQEKIILALKRLSKFKSGWTVYAIMDELPYEIKRDACCHSLRVLIQAGYVEHKGKVRVGNTQQQTFGLTAKGEAFDRRLPIDFDLQIKRCCECGTVKYFEDFGRNATRIDGQRAECKVCARVMAAKYYTPAPPKPIKPPKPIHIPRVCIDNTKLTPQQRKIHKLVSGKKGFSLKKGLPDSDITYKDLEIPEYCPVFPWLKLTFDSTDSRQSAASLDRIIPEKGYVRGNVKVVSMRANRIKSAATLEELISLGKWAEKELELISDTK